jgi:hypothetical protein
MSGYDASVSDVAGTVTAILCKRQYRMKQLQYMPAATRFCISWPRILYSQANYASLELGALQT